MGGAYERLTAGMALFKMTASNAANRNKPIKSGKRNSAAQTDKTAKRTDDCSASECHRQIAGRG
jgi:hypothetical protein